MKIVHMRKAFSMITAIFVMVIMASIGAMVMSTSGKIVKTTTAQYQHEQAILYAKSYTEYAVMAVSANDRTNCINDINGSIGNDPDNGDGYKVVMHIAYIAIGTANTVNCDTVLSSTVANTNTPLTIIIDVYVDYKEPDNPTLWRTVHRRTVQKI